MAGLQDEESWLRGCIIRLRTVLRFTKDERVDAGLKDIIANAERRLEQLSGSKLTPLRMRPVDKQAAGASQKGK